jgi:ferrochelatase
MTFENFGRLTGARLLNEPAISSFEKIETNVKKIKRGDLFVGDSKEDIALALDLEAYGIVSTINHKIMDEEIAWFQTDSLDEVLIRLLRFKLMQMKFHFVYLEHIESELIQSIAHKENLVFLDMDEKERYKTIINADMQSIIFCSDKNFLDQIYPEYESLSSLTKPIFQRDTKSHFLSSFIYQNHVFTDIKISPLLLDHLENAVSFLEQNNITYELEKCTYGSHFHPIFVNQKLKIKPFGRSEKVLICESDKSKVEEVLTYLKTEAPWAKTIYIESSDLERLKSSEFNFAIIVIEYDKLIEKLEKNEKNENILLF